MTIPTVAVALDDLNDAFVSDPSYVNSWHDNIACCGLDEGLEHGVANRVATRIMRHCFGVETKNPEDRHAVRPFSETHDMEECTP